MIVKTRTATGHRAMPLSRYHRSHVNPRRWPRECRVEALVLLQVLLPFRPYRELRPARLDSIRQSSGRTMHLFSNKLACLLGVLAVAATAVAMPRSGSSRGASVTGIAAAGTTESPNHSVPQQAAPPSVKRDLSRQPMLRQSSRGKESSYGASAETPTPLKHFNRRFGSLRRRS